MSAYVALLLIVVHCYTHAYSDDSVQCHSRCLSRALEQPIIQYIPLKVSKFCQNVVFLQATCVSDIPLSSFMSPQSGHCCQNVEIIA